MAETASWDELIDRRDALAARLERGELVLMAEPRANPGARATRRWQRLKAVWDDVNGEYMALVAALESAGYSEWF